jgi:hypothetical protein
MFCATMARAWAERDPASSVARAARTAARTSGGKSVEVLMINWRIESKNCGSIIWSV